MILFILILFVVILIFFISAPPDSGIGKMIENWTWVGIFPLKNEEEDSKENYSQGSCDCGY